jgi:hypothetical protein
MSFLGSYLLEDFLNSLHALLLALFLIAMINRGVVRAGPRGRLGQDLVEVRVGPRGG